MKIGKAGIDLLKLYEQGPDGGPALTSYPCSAGVWTIGYGHTKGVGPGQHCTEAQATAWLYEDANEAENAVNELVKVPLTQGQFDALVSLVFNIGRGRPHAHPKGPAGFHGSTLLRLLNDQNYIAAANQFPRWNKAGGKILNGLVARRADEQSLFIIGTGD